MKQYVKKYTENVPVILLLFYIFGGCYQFWFYRYFEIEIEFYINLTDLVFESIKNLFTTIFYFLLVEFFLILISGFFMSFCYLPKKMKKYEKIDIKIKNRYDKYVEYLKSENFKYYSFSFYFLLLFLGIWLFDEPFLFISIIFPNFVYKLYSIIPKDDKEDKELNNVMHIFLFSILFIILVCSYSYWGFYDASHIKTEYSSKIIKTNNIYTGDNVNKFIGETSDYYFILNSKNNVVTILAKSSINEINVETNKYQLKEIKKTKIELKNFIKKFKQE